MFLKRRVKRKSRVLCFLLIITACAGFYILNLNGWQWYQMVEQDICITPDHEMKDLRKLIQDSHRILKKFNLTHVVVYGSLFGALRINDILPWDNDADIAVLWEEVTLINEKDFILEFKKYDIDIYYRLWKGEYVIKRKKAQIDLMIFKETMFGERGRTGLEPWLFFVHFRNFHQFPSRLFSKPLPKLLFAGVNISAPREGLEIQKHFYPNDWWKESKPKGCI